MVVSSLYVDPPPPPPPGWGLKVKIELSQNMVMLHIKLKEMTNADSLSFHTPSTPGTGSKVNEFFF